MSLRLALAVCLLSAPLSVLAACDYRSNIALEAAGQQVRAAPLNYQGQQFVARETLSQSWALDQSCMFGPRITSQVKASITGTVLSSGHGSEQTRSQAHARSLLHEAYLTIETPGDMLVDIGKKEITNGYLLFLSPMDIVRTPIDPPPGAVINTAGPSWRNSYREGRVLLGAKKFLTAGSLELAVIPALGPRPGDRPLAQWSAVQRSNHQGALYAAYSANRLPAFNPKLVARVSSSQRHRVAIGVSDVLMDAVVFTVEVAHASHSQVHRIRQGAADLLRAGGFPDAQSVFETIPGSSLQWAAGVRINGPWQTTVIGEFYQQSGGYTRADWQRYFQFADDTLAAYSSSGVQPYLDYQRLMLSAADSDQRRYQLLGRRYVTLGLERSGEGGRISWHVSMLGNADDRSALLNLHLAVPLTQRTDLYLGGRAMLGARRSEFGRYGLSPLGYLGLNFSL